MLFGVKQIDELKPQKYLCVFVRANKVCSCASCRKTAAYIQFKLMEGEVPMIQKRAIKVSSLLRPLGIPGMGGRLLFGFGFLPTAYIRRRMRPIRAQERGKMS